MKNLTLNQKLLSEVHRELTKLVANDGSALFLKQSFFVIYFPNQKFAKITIKLNFCLDLEILDPNKGRLYFHSFVHDDDLELLVEAIASLIYPFTY